MAWVSLLNLPQPACPFKRLLGLASSESLSCSSRLGIFAKAILHCYILLPYRRCLPQCDPNPDPPIDSRWVAPDVHRQVAGSMVGRPVPIAATKRPPMRASSSVDDSTVPKRIARSAAQAACTGKGSNQGHFASGDEIWLWIGSSKSLKELYGQ